MGTRYRIGVGHREPRWASTATANLGTVTSGATIELAPYAIVPAGTTAVYTLLPGAPAGMTVNSATGQLGTSGIAATNTYNATVRLSMVGGRTTSTKIFTVTVIGVANAPVFTLSPTSATIPSTGGTIQFTATDADNHAITYSIQTGRTGISVDPSTGLVTVTSAAAGTTGNIVVRATDPLGLYTDSLPCLVTVQSSQPSTGFTLYVNAATGLDSRTYEQAKNPDTPWATVGRAARGSTNWAAPNASQAAQPGDTVIVASGIYWEDGYRGGSSSDNKQSVACNPANNGTASAPITFRGVGMPQMRMLQNARGGVIGANNRSYIVWDGFYIDDTYCGSGSDFGPVVLCNSAHHVTVQNCWIQGHSGQYYWGYMYTPEPGVIPETPYFYANYRLVAMEDAFYCTVRNNKISRARNGANYGGQNEGGVIAYDSPYNIIEQNTIWDCGSGIFLKGIHEDAIPAGGQTGNIIRRNLIYNCHAVGIWHNDGIGCHYYQNIVRDMLPSGATNSFRLSGAMPWNNTRDSVFQNNVVYNAGRSIITSDIQLGEYALNMQVVNNIVMNGGTSAYYDWARGSPTEYPTSFVANRNLFYNNATFWRSEGGGAYSFAQWQAIGKDLNSLNGQNPLFVNAAGGNFRLQRTVDGYPTNSPALTLGRDVLGLNGTVNATIPAGAYIIGTEQIGADW